MNPLLKYLLLLSLPALGQMQPGETKNLQELYSDREYKGGAEVRYKKSRQLLIRDSVFNKEGTTVSYFLEIHIKDTASFFQSNFISAADTSVAKMTFNIVAPLPVAVDFAVAGELEILSRNAKGFTLQKNLRIEAGEKILYYYWGPQSYEFTVTHKLDMNKEVKAGRFYRPACSLEKGSGRQMILSQDNETRGPNKNNYVLNIFLHDPRPLTKGLILTQADTTLVMFSYGIFEEGRSKLIDDDFQVKGSIEILSVESRRIRVRRNVVVTSGERKYSYYYGGKKTYIKFGPWPVTNKAK